MKTLSLVLKTSIIKEELESEDLKKIVFQRYGISENLEDVKKQINSYNERDLGKPRVKQELTLDLDEDKNMNSFFKLLDIISAFTSLSELYNKEKDNNLKWIDKEIYKGLKSINYYINQLASYISLSHEDVKIQLNFPSDGFDNSKRLDTIIKQTDEFKELKTLLNNGFDVSKQTLTVRAISSAIIDKTKKLLKIF